MQTVKTTLEQTSDVSDKNCGQVPDDTAAVLTTDGGRTEISGAENYPPIWRKAFALAHNVRFTRTPDVALPRKQPPVTEAPIPAPVAEMVVPEQETGADVMEVVAEIIPQTGEQATPPSIAEVAAPAQDVNADMPPVAEQAAPAGEQAVHTETAIPSGLFLSDFAFFEGFSLDIDLMQPVAAIKDEEAAAPVLQEATAPTPVRKDLPLTQLYRTVEWHKETAGEKVKEAAPVATSAASGSEQAIEVPVLPAVAESVCAVAEETSCETAAVPVCETVEEPPHETGQTAPAPAVVTPAPVIVPAPPVAPYARPFVPSVTRAANRDYTFPPVELLQEPVYQEGAVISQEMLERSAGFLESVLEDFGVKGEIIHVRPGPVVTLYEFEPAPGVKSSRVIGLSDDIARSMSAVSARVAVVPGRNVIGIELPNSVREMVYLREIIRSQAFKASPCKLALALGKNIGGEPVIAELAKMPHLLVAGTTGSGKSVAINTMILSLLYRLPPEKCRLIMVDPKMLELSVYDGIPHLLTPVVTDPKKAVTALKWAVREMEDRYRKMAKLGVRNIDGFNARVKEALANNETIMCTVQSGFDRETGEMVYHEEALDLTPLPYIVIIVDEMADLMMVAGKEIEGAIQRLAQMARAAGIHLIMATQRPSVDVITGTIKANFPTRISFQVTSKIDSRTILGEQGAETLLGQGDMLHMVGGGRIVRVHGPFVSDREVEQVVAHLKTQGTPEYLATVTDQEEEAPVEDDSDIGAEIIAHAGDDGEELYAQAVKVVMRDKKCSTSYIQRRLGIGYNKAATLVERMEDEGLVGAANHVGKREILISHH
ncbi:MAG: DNA translocase FtsK [Candidatus Tokpelaia hoelldobleri]|uniref:DNA translocase FtsK n=1 Tax=Candidatus Tokpelaia hoelldobleri TaxID=1902579 RepID=A0A1U9JSK9_9HYPH|nr:MAG: DNA translocase FtsK [Candidatus Tokpelaia hoelldoblerii]